MRVYYRSKRNHKISQIAFILFYTYYLALSIYLRNDVWTGLLIGLGIGDAIQNYSSIWIDSKAGIPNKMQNRRFVVIADSLKESLYFDFESWVMLTLAIYFGRNAAWYWNGFYYIIFGIYAYIKEMVWIFH